MYYHSDQQRKNLWQIETWLVGYFYCCNLKKTFYHMFLFFLYYNTNDKKLHSYLSLSFKWGAQTCPIICISCGANYGSFDWQMVGLQGHFYALNFKVSAIPSLGTLGNKDFRNCHFLSFPCLVCVILWMKCCSIF